MELYKVTNSHTHVKQRKFIRGDTAVKVPLGSKRGSQPMVMTPVGVEQPFRRGYIYLLYDSQ